MIGFTGQLGTPRSQLGMISLGQPLVLTTAAPARDIDLHLGHPIGKWVLGLPLGRWAFGRPQE
jgi:hypothetical protein